MDAEPARDTAADLEMIVQDARSRQKLELRLWLRMLSTTRLISQEIRRRLRAEFGATLPQFDLMAQLERERDGLRLGELSRRTMVTNGNTTGLIDRLEADGLILRETPGEDRRVTVAKLTPQGVKLFATMARAHEGWLKDMMAQVDAPTKALLLELLGGIKTSTTMALSDSKAD
jgi:DNA-binding MarR family transcriptional regulator